MDIEILKQKETPLLKRKRISAAADYEGATPSRTIIRKALAKKLGVAENLLVIRHIYTRFGKQKAKIIAHAYEDEKSLATLEEEKMVAKHKGKEPEKATDAQQ